MGVNTSATPATYVHEGDQVTPETPLAFVDQEQAAENGEDMTVLVVVDKGGQPAEKSVYPQVDKWATTKKLPRLLLSRTDDGANRV